MSIKILLVDNHKIMREGLRSLLESQSDIQVVGEAGTGADAVRLVREVKPDMVITEVDLPDMDGNEAARQMLQDNPDIKIIALSQFPKKIYIARMLEAGASAYIVKSSSIKELLRAIRAVRQNRTYLSENISHIALDDYKHHLISLQNNKSSMLTPRELKVLKMLAEGKSSKEIAFSMNKSPKTIDASRRQIMNKLHIDNLADLIKYAIKEGITSVDSFS